MTRAEARFLRRLAARRALTDPVGTREVDDRRQAERRAASLTGATLDRRLRELGLSGDRRMRKDRRTGGDRRRF